MTVVIWEKVCNMPNGLLKIVVSTRFQIKGIESICFFMLLSFVLFSFEVYKL